jgi:hypothetical protein
MTDRSPTALLMRFAFPLLLALLCVGCMQTEATMLDDVSRSPVSAAEVKVYTDTSDVECSFEEVAVIRSRAAMSSTGEQQIIENGKKKAGTVGANALIVRRLARVASNSNPSRDRTQHGKLQGRFLAVFEDRPCT